MSQKPAHIAVLLAAYNGREFITEQLDSILQQQGVSISLFISVDLSTDNTYQYCCDFARQYPQITVLDYGQHFGGAAANFYRLIKDVDFAQFDAVALADQDDIWLDTKLLTASTKLRKEGFAAYSSNVMAFWADGRKHLIHKANPQRNYDYLFEAAGPGCSYVLSTSALLQFKALLNSQWQQAQAIGLHDWFIYAFFRAHHLSWFIDPEYQLLYRQHAANQVGINKGWRANLKRLQLLRKGWCKQQVVGIADLVGSPDLNVRSRLAILSNISQLRRRFRDRCLLFFIAFFGLY